MSNNAKKNEKSVGIEMQVKLDKRKVPHLLRGFKDVLPDDERYWDLIFNTVREMARAYGFSRIITPTLEEKRLFEQAYGSNSRLVSQELFQLDISELDDEGTEIQKKSAEVKPTVLRPDAAGPLVRAYLEHGMASQPQPVKLWTFAPMFRSIRPQAGCYRQFYQWGFEVLGEVSPLVDAQIIIMTHNIYRRLGLDVVVPINSLGDEACRPAYIENLKGYLQPKSRQICAECRAHLKSNPLRVFGCREERCQEILTEAPQMIDWLCEDCRSHFVEVLELLDEIEVSYVLDSRLVRARDFHTRTIFEVLPRDQYEAEAAGPTARDGEASRPESVTRRLILGGGGRHDDLPGLLGGKDLPGVGAFFGVERAVIVMKRTNVYVSPVQAVELFVASLGREARRKALRLFEQLRERGYQVAEHFAQDGLSAQLAQAERLNAQQTLILGQKEMLDGTILLRDMASGMQEEVNFDKIYKEVEKRVARVTVTTSMALEAVANEESEEDKEASNSDPENGKEVALE